MRLVLGDHDLLLRPGETSAEVLRLFGRQGEQMHVRAQFRQ